MLNLNNTLDGYLKNVEVIGNTIQDTNNLANIRSVGDKVEGQELYKIELACYGDNILRPDFELGLWNVSNGTAQVDSTAIRTKGFLRIRNQAHLVKRFDGKLGCQVILFDENFKYLGQQSYAGGNYVRYDNILPNAKYMKINFLNTTDLNLQCVLFDRVPSNINGVEFVEFQESELEILSPVQLEKVGDVADRIICKDGVWGVEKPIGNFVLNGSEPWESGVTANNTTRYRILLKYIPSWDIKASKNVIGSCDKFPVYVNSQYNVDTPLIENDQMYISIRSNILNNVEEFKTWLKNNNVSLKYIKAQTQFIPLPHDQQVKLRTFAGQTNIAFLTEIAGQIKAQVPKSLGATVNTHTEQIADLHNSLDRVKKLEETTVSTIETESSFTAVDATSNGYFEDVKLEGKTLVNLFDYSKLPISTGSYVWSKTANGVGITFTNARDVVWRDSIELKANTTYTIIYDLEVIINQDNNDNGEISAVGYFIYNKSQKANWYNQYYNSDLLKISIDSLGVKFTRKVKAKFTTQEDSYLGLGATFFNSGVTGVTNFTNLMLLEGDHTNNPPEFFEGLMSVGQDVEEVSVESKNSDETQINKKPLLYYNPTTETWEKPILREWDTIEKHSDGKYYYHKRSGEVVLNGSESWNLPDATLTNTIRFRLDSYLPGQAKVNAVFICNTLSFDKDWFDKDVEGYTITNESGHIYIRINRSKLSTQDVAGFKAWLKANPTTLVYQLAQEEVYECTNIDLMTYSGETNYIINSGTISPKSLLKVHNNIANVVKILQEKVSLLENTFIAGLKSVLSGDMYSLATILYPEDFEQNDNTEQDIMVIPEQ